MHGRIKAKFSAIFGIYSSRVIAILQYSTVRCEKRILNNETRWYIPVNLVKISLVTKAFAQNIIQNRLTQDDEVTLAIRKIKHTARCLDANKALGFALCFIDILAACLMLYFTYSTRSHALTNTYNIINSDICFRILENSYVLNPKE